MLIPTPIAFRRRLSLLPGELGIEHRAFNPAEKAAVRHRANLFRTDQLAARQPGSNNPGRTTQWLSESIHATACSTSPNTCGINSGTVISLPEASASFFASLGLGLR